MKPLFHSWIVGGGSRASRAHVHGFPSSNNRFRKARDPRDRKGDPPPVPWRSGLFDNLKEASPVIRVWQVWTDIVLKHTAESTLRCFLLARYEPKTSCSVSIYVSRKDNAPCSRPTQSGNQHADDFPPGKFLAILDPYPPKHEGFFSYLLYEARPSSIFSAQDRESVFLTQQDRGRGPRQNASSIRDYVPIGSVYILFSFCSITIMNQSS